MTRVLRSPERWVVLFSGSRCWRFEEVETRVAKIIRQYPDDTLFIHGGADGLDSAAHRLLLLEQKRRPVQILKVPYFRDLGTQGGVVRNACLVAHAKVWLTYGYQVAAHAMPHPVEDSPGTLDFIARVEPITEIDLHVWRKRKPKEHSSGHP